MKLSEVIKAKGKFQQGPHFAIQLTDEDLIIKFFDQTLFLKLDEDWEEVKPPRQWSEKELMLFELLPDWAKWISKDGDDGSVFIFNEKPQKLNCVFKGEVGTKSDFVCQTGTIIDDFLTITFEESPIYIGDLKGE